MTQNTTVTPTTIGLIVVLGAIYGSAFTLIKVLIDDLTPLEMAAGRLALGALAIIVVLAARGAVALPSRTLLVPIAILAALDTLIPYALVGWAESHIESGTAAVLISAMPLFTVAFAAALGDEHITGGRLAGVAIGFAGVLVLVGSPAAFRDSDAAGQIAVVGAAASYAAGALYARRLLTRINAANLVASKLVIGAALAAMATVGAGQGSGLTELSANHVAALVMLGVVCTGLSFVLYFRLVAQAGSVAGSTVTYIIPAFGLFFGGLFLGEAIHPRTIGGLALIAAGVSTVMYGPSLACTASRLTARRSAIAGSESAG